MLRDKSISSKAGSHLERQTASWRVHYSFSRGLSKAISHLVDKAVHADNSSCTKIYRERDTYIHTYIKIYKYTYIYIVTKKLRHLSQHSGRIW